MVIKNPELISDAFENTVGSSWRFRVYESDRGAWPDCSITRTNDSSFSVGKVIWSQRTGAGGQI